MGGFFDYLRMVMGWWSSTPSNATETPFRLLHRMSYTGGAKVLQSYLGGAGDQIQSFRGGPVQVMADNSGEGE